MPRPHKQKLAMKHNLTELAGVSGSLVVLLLRMGLWRSFHAASMLPWRDGRGALKVRSRTRLSSTHSKASASALGPNGTGVTPFSWVAPGKGRQLRSAVAHDCNRSRRRCSTAATSGPHARDSLRAMAKVHSRDASHAKATGEGCEASRCRWRKANPPCDRATWPQRPLCAASSSGGPPCCWTAMACWCAAFKASFRLPFLFKARPSGLARKAESKARRSPAPR